MAPYYIPKAAEPAEQRYKKNFYITRGKVKFRPFFEYAYNFSDLVLFSKARLVSMMFLKASTKYLLEAGPYTVRSNVLSIICTSEATH